MADCKDCKDCRFYKTGECIFQSGKFIDIEIGGCTAWKEKPKSEENNLDWVKEDCSGCYHYGINKCYYSHKAIKDPTYQTCHAWVNKKPEEPINESLLQETKDLLDKIE